MTIAKTKTISHIDKQWFLDPSKCKEYIKHANQSDYAGIRVSCRHCISKTDPISIQLIFDALETANDRKFMRFNCNILDGGIGTAYSFHIISNGLRFQTCSKFDGSGIEYKFAGGSYDGAKGNIPTSLGKHNFIADGSTGTITLDEKRIQDISTLPIPDQTYYYGENYVFKFMPSFNDLEIMAVSSDTRAFYCKFYAMRVINGDGTMCFDLRPCKNGNDIGLKNLVTGEEFFKSYGNGSFVYGIDD